MDKSLLDLLKDEKETLQNINSYNSDVTYFSELNVSSNVISERKEKAVKTEEKLLSIRKEIKEYFSFLQNL